MRVLVVVGDTTSCELVRAAAAMAITHLRASGHRVDVIDLRAEGSRAAMSEQERDAYHGDEPAIDPVVRRHIELVKSAEAMVFAYQTTWCGSMPAIVKGWLERTMVPGVGFTFDATGRVRPGLRRVRHLVGISTSPRRSLWRRASRDHGRRTITRALRVSTGLTTRCTWLSVGDPDRTGPLQREKVLRRVRSMARSL